MPPEEQPAPKKQRMSFDLRIVVVLLLLVIAALIMVWKPWDTVDPNDRTISVTGEATISAEPDEYVFSPNYEFVSANPDTALTELTDKSNQIVSELKKLGVEDSHIKTNASNYEFGVSRKPGTEASTYTLSLTITVPNKDLAQKVQDYLLTTSPTGNISPQATFSETKRKQLEDEARDKATEDARNKAGRSAQNLGFSVGKVKEVSDTPGFGVFPVGRAEDTTTSQEADQLTIQPGENDLTYTVTVVYYVN